MATSPKLEYSGNTRTYPATIYSAGRSLSSIKLTDVVAHVHAPTRFAILLVGGANSRKDFERL